MRDLKRGLETMLGLMGGKPESKVSGLFYFGMCKWRKTVLIICGLSFLWMMLDILWSKPNPNRIERFTLRTANNTHTISLPASYEVNRSIPEKFNSELLEFTVKYPSMAPSPESLITEKIVFISVFVIPKQAIYKNAVEAFLDLDVKTKSYLLIGNDGTYDIYRAAQPYINGNFGMARVFTAKDGERVLIRDINLIHRNIKPNLEVGYHIGAIDKNYVAIDEIATRFVKAHLQSRSLK